MTWNRQEQLEWLILPFNRKEEMWRRSHPHQHESEITFCTDIKAANETPLGVFIADCSSFWSYFRYRRLKQTILSWLWRRDWNKRTGAILKRKAPTFIYVPSEGRCLQPKQIIELARERGCSVAELMGRLQKLEREEAIAQYNAGEITEGHLACCLGVDRLEARRIVERFREVELCKGLIDSLKAQKKEIAQHYESAVKSQLASYFEKRKQMLSKLNQERLPSTFIEQHERLLLDEFDNYQNLLIEQCANDVATINSRISVLESKVKLIEDDKQVEAIAHE